MVDNREKYFEFLSSFLNDKKTEIEKLNQKFYEIFLGFKIPEEGFDYEKEFLKLFKDYETERLHKDM